MEILIHLPEERPRLKVALFDFDGTISTLRHGWEGIMEPLMLEMIAGRTHVDNELITEVREYIDQSVGIQTIHQMIWLAEAVKRYGRNPGAPDDPWRYKEEYNRRLMESVEKRKASLRNGEKTRQHYLMKGSEMFLESLKCNGIDIYIASGTDQPDVLKEVETLGLTKYFKEIAGAPLGKIDCSKEAVLRKLVYENKLEGLEVVVIGDGKIEIALGREVGAITLGLASDEDKLSGINPAKRKRLVKAGAHVISGDFENINEILSWLGLEQEDKHELS
jgi:phosphoglycolate phosphatase-like HAD superfamily hydrolase